MLPNPSSRTIKHRVTERNRGGEGTGLSVRKGEGVLLFTADLESSSEAFNSHWSTSVAVDQPPHTTVLYRSLGVTHRAQGFPVISYQIISFYLTPTGVLMVHCAAESGMFSMNCCRLPRGRYERQGPHFKPPLYKVCVMRPTLVTTQNSCCIFMAKLFYCYKC